MERGNTKIYKKITDNEEPLGRDTLFSYSLRINRTERDTLLSSSVGSLMGKETEQILTK